MLEIIAELVILIFLTGLFFSMICFGPKYFYGYSKFIKSLEKDYPEIAEKHTKELASLRFNSWMDFDIFRLRIYDQVTKSDDWPDNLRIYIKKACFWAHLQAWSFFTAIFMVIPFIIITILLGIFR